MSRLRPLTLALLLLGPSTRPAVSDRPGEADQGPKDVRAQLRPGLSPEQVRRLLGPPHQVAREVLAHRRLEQWLYFQPHFLRLELTFPRGERPQLLAVRPLPPAGP